MNVARNFAYEHLPSKLQAASRPFCNLAIAVDQTWHDSEEKQTCLRKLLEAKDCAVRCALEAMESPAGYADALPDDAPCPVTQPSGGLGGA